MQVIKLLAKPLLPPNTASHTLLSLSSTYRSAISLNTLYPNSTLKITTPPPPAEEGKFTGYIPVEQLQITYSKSSGPGGQNVNKVNTKVDVRFHLESAKWIDVETKTKLAQKVICAVLA